jgi:hypothetical protein
MAGSTVLRYFDDPRIFEGSGPRSKAITDFIERNNRDFFFLKSDDFETEHEYRAVVMPGKAGESAYDNQVVTIKGDYVYVDYGDALAAVIVGERVPNRQRLAAKRWTERKGAQFGKIGWRAGRPWAFPPVVDNPDDPIEADAPFRQSGSATEALRGESRRP